MKKKIDFENIDEKTMNEIYQKTVKSIQFQEKIQETKQLFKHVQLPIRPSK